VADKETLEPLGIVTRVMSSLRAMTDPKGVSQSVIKDENRETDTLSTSEQKKLIESATIIGRTLKIGSFNDSKEAKKEYKKEEVKENKTKEGVTSFSNRKSAKNQPSEEKLLPKEKEKRSIFSELSASEKNRFKEIATIIGKVLQVGAFREGPEAKRLKDLTPIKTATESFKVSGAIKDKVSIKKETEGSLIDTLKKIAGVAGLGALLWKLLPEEWKDKVKNWWSDTLTYLFGDEGKQKLYNMWDGLWNSLFSRDKDNKGIIAKWWDDMIGSFLTDEESKSKSAGRFTSWFDNLWNSALDKDGKTKDKFLTFWDNIFNIDEGTQLNLAQKVAFALGRVIQGSIDVIAKSFEASGVAGDVAIAQKLTKVAAKVLPDAKPKSPPSSKAAPTVNRGEARTIAKQKEFTSGVKKDGTRWYKKGNDFIGEKDVPKSVVKRLTSPSTGSKVLDWGADLLKTTKTKALGITEQLSKLGTVWNAITKTGRGAAALIKFVGKIPFLAQLIEAGSAYLYNKEQENLYNEKKISLDEYQLRVGNKIADSWGGALGALGGGALLGGVVGGASLLTGVLAPLAPYLGFMASIIGTAAGDFLGRKMADFIISDENAKIIGANYTNTNIVGEELQDFLVKGNNVYKFSHKDEVLGMKTGGAIDNLMTGITQGLAKDNATIKDASIKQVDKLEELVFLMRELIKKPSSNMSINNTSASMQQIPNKTFDIRDQFSPYTLLPSNLVTQ
jgi:hypothetical protein